MKVKKKSILAKKIKKILIAKNKPLFGNNRSFSNRATHRKFATNRQKFRINSRTYYIPVKSFWSYWLKIEKSL